MTPFRSSGGLTYKVRVRHPETRALVALSTGTRDREEADEIERLAKRWVGKDGRRYARPDVVRALVAKRLTLAEAVDAHHDGTLNGVLARIEREDRERTAAAADPDLRPHVDAWHAEKRASKRGAASADRYRRQVLALYPEGEPLRASTFTLRALWRKLDALKVDDPTRNRYRAAASSFAKYLVKRGLLDRNPARDVEGYGEGAKRTVYYPRETAREVIARLPQPYAAIEALMCGAGLEWQAIERLRARDVEPYVRTVLARGGKTRTRTRTCVIFRDNEWTVDYVLPALSGKVGDALVFAGHVPDPGLDPTSDDYRRASTKYSTRALRRHRAAVRAAGAEPSTLHDWRHTHAVQALRDGYKPAAVAHNLGHANSYMVLTRYGVFVPDLATDYEPRPPAAPTSPVTEPVTSSRKPSRGA